MSAVRDGTVQLFLPRPHAGQRALLAGQRRFNIACMGRRFGKTKFGIAHKAAPILAAGYPVGWFAPGYKYVSEVWRDAKRYLAPLISVKNEQEKRLELVTGGVLEFWTLDGEDAARGRKYRLTIVDEAAMIRGLRDKWQKAIRPTLTDYRGEAWFLSTPKGRNDFLTLWDEAERKPDSWARFQMPTTANPFIDPEEVEEARQDLPELVYRQEYLAEFINQQGLCFRATDFRYDTPPVNDVSYGMGVDLAISSKEDANWTAIVVAGLHRDGRRFVVDAYRFRAPFHRILQEVDRMARKWKPGRIGVEAVQFQMAAVQELLRTTALPVIPVTPDKDKVTRAQPMIARYEHGLVYHAPGLPAYFEDELLSFPAGQNDDLVDAAVMAHDAAAQGIPGRAAVAGRLESEAYG